MSLTLDQIERIARLAHIEISPTEAGQTRDRLNSIFELIEQLQAVDTTGLKNLGADFLASNPYRKDKTAIRIGDSAYNQNCARCHGLEAISGCHRRIVLLHYAPVPETLVGEPETIWAFLGSSRLAAPIGAHRPDLVLHGHAHRGSFAADLGPVPVRNVAVHVIGKDFEHFEL